jgi:hypothetical protein
MALKALSAQLRQPTPTLRTVGVCVEFPDASAEFATSVVVVGNRSTFPAPEMVGRTILPPSVPWTRSRALGEPRGPASPSLTAEDLAVLESILAWQPDDRTSWAEMIESGRCYNEAVLSRAAAKEHAPKTSSSITDPLQQLDLF